MRIYGTCYYIPKINECKKLSKEEKHNLIKTAIDKGNYRKAGTIKG